jgi:hypothetical protein
MELQELMTINPESLTARQAQQVVRDTIATLSAGVMHQYQQPLKELLREAQQIALDQRPDEQAPNARQDVVKRIEDAEARGDKQAAYFLKKGMVDAGTAAVEAETRAAEATLATEKFIADDLAADEVKQKRRQEEMIEARTQELIYAHGWERSTSELREQATKEVLGSTDDEPWS